MTKFFAYITFLLMSFCFIAENTVAYPNAAAQVVLQGDEDSGAEENKQKSAKEENLKEKYVSLQQSYSPLSAVATALPGETNKFLYSSGFTDKPYTPPDLM